MDRKDFFSPHLFLKFLSLVFLKNPDAEALFLTCATRFPKFLMARLLFWVENGTNPRTRNNSLFFIDRLITDNDGAFWMISDPCTLDRLKKVLILLLDHVHNLKSPELLNKIIVEVAIHVVSWHELVEYLTDFVNGVLQRDSHWEVAVLTLLRQLVEELPEYTFALHLREGLLRALIKFTSTEDTFKTAFAACWTSALVLSRLHGDGVITLMGETLLDNVRKIVLLFLDSDRETGSKLMEELTLPFLILQNLGLFPREIQKYIDDTKVALPPRPVLFLSQKLVDISLVTQKLIQQLTAPVEDVDGVELAIEDVDERRNESPEVSLESLIKDLDELSENESDKE